MTTNKRHRSEDRGKGCEQRNVRNVALDANPFPTLLAPTSGEGANTLISAQ